MACGIWNSIAYSSIKNSLYFCSYLLVFEHSFFPSLFFAICYKVALCRGVHVCLSVQYVESRTAQLASIVENCKALKRTKKKIMKKRHPETHLASSLILVSSHNTQERAPILWKDQHIHTDSNIREPYGRGPSHQMWAPQPSSMDYPPLY